jgi:hypothetical protein
VSEDDHTQKEGNLQRIYCLENPFRSKMACMELQHQPGAWWLSGNMLARLSYA